MQQEIKIEIPKGGKPPTQEEMNKVMNSTIFRPDTPETKTRGWIRNKMMTYINKHHPGRKRFNAIHKVVKYRLAYPAFRLIEKYLSKYLVKDLDGIPNEWFNAHLRMFFWSMNKGLKDMWQNMYYTMGPDSVRCKDHSNKHTFYEWTKENNKSHKFRAMIPRIWMTEVLEDTVDREWLNFFVLELWHAMNDFYKGKVPKPGEFPIFLSTNPQNPPYFIQGLTKKTWDPPEDVGSKEHYNKLVSELGELKKYKEQKEKEAEALKPKQPTKYKQIFDNILGMHNQLNQQQQGMLQDIGKNLEAMENEDKTKNKSDNKKHKQGKSRSSKIQSERCAGSAHGKDEGKPSETARIQEGLAGTTAHRGRDKRDKKTVK